MVRAPAGRRLIGPTAVSVVRTHVTGKGPGVTSGREKNCIENKVMLPEIGPDDIAIVTSVKHVEPLASKG